MITKSKSSAETEGNANGRGDSTPETSKAWYGGGTWRRGSKATPVTQVAKESILAATDKASEFLINAQNPTAQALANPMTSPSVYLSRSLRRSNKSPSAASIAPRSGAASESLSDAQSESQKPAPSNDGSVQNGSPVSNQPDSKEKPLLNPPLESDPANPSSLKGAEGGKGAADVQSMPWHAWFLRNGNTTKSETPKPPDAVSQPIPSEPESPTRRRNSDPSAASSNTAQDTLPRSWLGLWTARSIKTKSADGATIAAASIDKPLSSSVPATPNAEDFPAMSNTQPSTSKAPGWAFWSREASGDTAVDTVQGNEGELVLAGPPATASSSLNSPRNASAKRPVSMEPARNSTGPHPAPAQTPSKTSSELTKKPSKSRTSKNDSLGADKAFKNLLLPSMASTYQPAPRLSLLQSLSRWWQDDRPSGGNRLKILHNPPRIKKALAIGVHGYFPAPLIRSVLGQPTGTSVRFADGAATAIQSWTRAHGYECTIEKVALEGEGRIIERVNMLWKLLLNWIDNIRQADFVMVACHSQGVPVAIMLIAKLIEFGCVQDARIGVCAMAGVNLGPFIDFKSRWIGGSAGELFDFARSDSQVSKDYAAALTKTLKSGVRIAYIGSIDDQLVSLESSTFGTVDHPFIYRAVFVNGSVHAPDFLTHLVGFALKLRNLGISDHGLIRELSLPLAGSLYSGEGHSTIYEDSAVYYLAVQNALETSAIGELNLARIHEGAPASQNPYILPFSVRGVLEEDYVKNELHEETMELLRQFDDWKPSSKALKDVKFRLEGV